MFYLVKTPGWLKKVFRQRVWAINTLENEIYLTFDDGPHPEHTVFVLDLLKKHDAKATFFCIGKNVKAYPELYERILNEGHAVGNHTHDHLNAGKTADDLYLANIKLAQKYIDSKLFRPPYGKISSFLVEQLLLPTYNLKTIMWTVLSGDFDSKLSGDQCAKQVILNTRPGSIVVFHDSEKASERMRFALPEVLTYFEKRGFLFSKISGDML